MPDKEEKIVSKIFVFAMNINIFGLN